MQNHRQLGPTIARIALALPLVAIPVSYFFQLAAPPHQGQALTFIDALIGSGYLMDFVKGTELVVGLALLANRFVPLALAVLAPVMLNILAFHVFLEPHSTAFPLALAALHAYLAHAYRHAYGPLLTAHAEPGHARLRTSPDLVANRAASLT